MFGAVAVYALILPVALVACRGVFFSLISYDRKRVFVLVSGYLWFLQLYGGFDVLPRNDEFTSALRQYLDLDLPDVHPMRHALNNTAGEIVVVVLTKYKQSDETPNYENKFSEDSGLNFMAGNRPPRGGYAKTVAGAKKRAQELQGLGPGNIDAFVKETGGLGALVPKLIDTSTKNRGIAVVDVLHPYISLPWLYAIYDQSPDDFRLLITWKSGYREIRGWDEARIYRFQSMRSYLELLLHPRVLDAYRHEHAACDDFLVMTHEGYHVGWIIRGTALLFMVLLIGIRSPEAPAVAPKTKAHFRTLSDVASRGLPKSGRWVVGWRRKSETKRGLPNKMSKHQRTRSVSF